MEPAIVMTVVFVVAAVIVSTRIQFNRGTTILERWAANNGYRIFEQKFLMFGRGPFRWNNGENRVVFRVRARDMDGTIRHGHVRCGDSVFGMLWDDAEVRWDKEPAYQPGFPVVVAEERHQS